MIKQKITLFPLAISILLSISCNPSTEKVETVQIPTSENPKEWSKNATIYEVNIRQYTPEGTINAFAEHLPQLDSLGVDILWLMPIFPIGEENRKGGMGSAYSIKDYQAVNPDFGTLEDLKNLVAKAHKLGMHVILDWVANHTAWDNELATTHPNWFKKDSLGNFTPPVPDWADVIDLDYDNKDMRSYMINSLKFWVNEAGIDGFRCDVAMMVPTDFWEDARAELDSIKPMFMLAEADQPDHLLKAFDMNYGWELHHIMNEIAKGEMKVSELDTYFHKNDSLYQPDDIKMNFTSNHDENSWNGTVKERMGDAAEMMAVFSYMAPGMPLIYSGQEVGLDKRLAFFEKDTIQWVDTKWRGLYTQLNHLKKENQALWNGINGGGLTRINTNAETVYAFEREKEGNRVIAIFNMSAEAQQISITNEIEPATLTNYFTNEEIKVKKGLELPLAPWNYLVFTNK
ncbi:MAG: alpha-glucosidase C-terminal domain-containing protein [Cyclobacteriaceae bacterium]|nr:alpha-glucosidase C-terminal domain-containing protein [Cyclobacteriaceae bacterium]